MAKDEVVITGMGLITPLGNNIAENWENLKNKKQGISHYPKEGLPNCFQYMGKVTECRLPDDIPHKLMGQAKFLNRSAMLGFLSAYETISQPDIMITDTLPERRALYIASGDSTKAGYDFIYPALKEATGNKWEDIDFQKLNQAALSKINPFFLLESLNNNLFSFLSAYLEFMGPNTSLANLSPCGGHALELAAKSILNNKADIALAVGYGNWITEVPLYEIEQLGILSGCAMGAHSFRPFDRYRDGFIPSEGGAAILLESAARANRRGAKIIGKIRGLANYNELSPGKGFSVPQKVSKRSIELAIKDAECSLSDIAFINPHGSGTQKGDRSELRSIADIIYPENLGMPICGLKPYTGHMGAASDLAEIIFGIKAAKEGIVPATLNFEAAEKEFSGLRISNSHQDCSKNIFLSVSYGIGGQSSAVVVEVN